MALFKRRKKEDGSSEAEDKGSSSEKKSKTSMKDLYRSEEKTEKKEDKKTESKSGPEKKASKKEAASSGEPAGRVKKDTKAYRILLKPIVTERSGELGVKNKYVFEVSRDSNKPEVAKAIKEVYGVKPVKVNLINMKGKKVRFGRIYGKRRDWKKAIVTLPKNKTINVYEGV